MDYELVNLLSSCTCALVFTILLLWDVIKAFRRRALWIPAEALVLSALTIQILGLIDYSQISYTGNKSQTNEEVENLLEADQLVIDSARLMMCVFLSYLIPQMVRSRWTRVWSDTGALVLAVMFHMGVELYFVWKAKEAYDHHQAKEPCHHRRAEEPCHHSQSIWFFVSSTTLFIDSTLLLLLLTCAVFAGKSIRKVISQKVPLALSCCGPAQPKCGSIEDHIFKCWLVTRASHPDYIMARSVFSALPGLVVSVSVVILVIKWRYIQLQSNYDIIRKITVFVDAAFVLVGWMVVLFRWFISVWYFPKNVQVLFYMEDFWTRSIAEVKDDLDTQSKNQLYMKKRNRGRKLVEKVLVTLVATIGLHSLLLPMRIWLQKLIVYLSKTCWLLSEFVLGMIRPFIMSPEKKALLSGSNTSDDHNFLKYQEALDIIRMRGEVAYSLWTANEWAFNQTQNHMEQGTEEGRRSTKELVKLITGPVENEATSLVVLEEEKHFNYLGEKSWKMRANSLIYCMIHFYDGTGTGDKDVINDAIEACSQAWDFMDFIDDSDEGAKLVSLAADKAFYTVKNIWKKDSEKLLERKIKKPFREDMEQLSKDGRLGADQESQHDSKDWMRAALQINLYKTWKAIEHNSVDPIHNLVCLLANVIVHCIDKEMDKALIGNCTEWAKKGREAEIYSAAFIAGKLKGVQILTGKVQGERDQIGEGNVPV